MSFWTTLHLYRPTPPPKVTGADLAAFLRDLDATGAFEPSAEVTVRLKFGRAIDQDARGISRLISAGGVSGFSKSESIAFDVDERASSVATAASLLADDERQVYRAYVELGGLKTADVQALQTRRPDDGDENMALWAACVNIGAIGLSTLDGDRSFDVGWMSVGIGGNGYLWPWGPRDLTDRAAARPALAAFADACRSRFPVDPDYVGPGLIRRQGSLGRLRPASRQRTPDRDRRTLGNLWPFDRLDVPWDWYFGVAESG